jgi:hypothetical protein
MKNVVYSQELDKNIEHRISTATRQVPECLRGYKSGEGLMEKINNSYNNMSG